MKEEEECKDQASSYSWWWDSHNNPHHSQWLQATLSDLDKKIKMMLNLIEEDGDSFGKRAEMYYQKRPELIKIIEDLHKSYRFLAEKYDKLRSDSTKLPADEHSSTPFENFIKQVQHPSSITSSSTTSSEMTSTKPNSLENGIGGVDTEIDGVRFDRYKRRGDLGSWKREEMWNELLRLKASKLVEDNLMQQAELVRRNDEKRKNIKALCIHINRLMEENKALKSRMAAYAHFMKQNQSPMSKIKQLILGKFSR